MKREKAAKDVSGTGFGGLFRGLGDLVERLGELAEKGEELKRTGEIHGQRGMRGIYGFSVKVGLGDEGVKVEPFGSVRPSGDRAEVREIREPMVDIFDEKGHVLVVAEMPGIGASDLKVDLADDILTLHATKGNTSYQKEVLLPRAFTTDLMAVTCNNGVVEIKLQDRRGSGRRAKA